jgi:hypothetical protein
MKLHYRILTGVLAVLVSTAPLAAREDPDPESQSAKPAATLAALLDQRSMDVVAAADPDEPGRVIAALYVPGAQLLVISSPYPVPALLEKQLGERKYMDVYMDIQSARSHEGQFFVMDLQANGLRSTCEVDQPFDSTSRNGGTHVSFDGKFEAQQLTATEYEARFDEDDARYARMLTLLASALTEPRTAAAGTRKGGK